MASSITNLLLWLSPAMLADEEKKDEKKIRKWAKQSVLSGYLDVDQLSRHIKDRTFVECEAMQTWEKNRGLIRSDKAAKGGKVVSRSNEKQVYYQFRGHLKKANVLDKLQRLSEATDSSKEFLRKVRNVMLPDGTHLSSTKTLKQMVMYERQQDASVVKIRKAINKQKKKIGKAKKKKNNSEILLKAELEMDKLQEELKQLDLKAEESASREMDALSSQEAGEKLWKERGIFRKLKSE